MTDVIYLGFNGMTVGDYSPEKAGAGGSIPSLATMFSITCKPLKTASQNPTAP